MHLNKCMFYIRHMFSFSFWYVILDAHLILSVISHGLYSSHKIHSTAIFCLNKYAAKCSAIATK